jgi:hypothetical protein
VVALGVEAKASEAEAVEGMAACVAVAAVAAGRLAVALVVKAEVAEAKAGEGKFATASIVVLLDGKATSAFPDKNIQNIFALARVDRRARPSNLARYAIGRVFGWQEGAAGAGSSRDKE